MGSCVSKQNPKKPNPDQKITLHNVQKPKLNPVNDTWGPNVVSSFENIEKYYEIITIIGQGAFGMIKLAAHKINKGPNGEQKLYAIKTIEKEKVKDQIHTIQRELEILKALDHPNIIKFYETYHDAMYFHFVIEYCDGGDLLDLITQRRTIDEYETSKIMKQLFVAVSYMHSKNIIHRDLKLENCIFKDKTPDSVIKIIDFGLSIKQDLTEERKYTIVGSPFNIAPEVVSKDYGRECDYWALGVIMYSLLSGRDPFPGDIVEAQAKIQAGEVNFDEDIWFEVSSKAKDLIKKLLTVDPKKRITCQQSLKHEWFSSFVMQEAQAAALKKNQQQEDNKQNFNMVNQNKQCKLAKEVIRKFIQNNTSNDELKEIENIFRNLDKNGRGVLSFEEIFNGLKQQNCDITEQNLLNILNNIIDTQEKDARKIQLNYTEFIGAVYDWKSKLNEEKMWQLFKFFDTTNSGYISVQNIKEVLQREGRKLKDNELQEMINEINTTSNGLISYKDFQRMMWQDIDSIKVARIQENAM